MNKKQKKLNPDFHLNPNICQTANECSVMNKQHFRVTFKIAIIGALNCYFSPPIVLKYKDKCSWILKITLHATLIQ
jgi:hypothetical protein